MTRPKDWRQSEIRSVKYDPNDNDYYLDTLLEKNHPKREYYCHHCNEWVAPIIATIGGISPYKIHWEICFLCQKILWESRVNVSHFIRGE